MPRWQKPAAIALALFAAAYVATASAQDVGDYKISVQNVDHNDWLLADGRAVSRVDRSNLFNVVGTTFGTGDGSTTFNLPDLRGRMPMMANNVGLPNGADGGLATRNIGDIAGAESHTLTEAQVPGHTHTAGTFSAAASTATVYQQGDVTDPNVPFVAGNNTGRGGSGIAVNDALSGGGAVTGTSASTGGGGSHSIIGPVAVAGSSFIFAGALTPPGPTDPHFANVVLLPDFGTATPSDLSNSAHSLSLLGSATVTNGALNLNGAGALHATADSADWDYGTGDWTIEGYIELDGYGATNGSVIVAGIPNTGFAAGGWGLRIFLNTGLDLAAIGAVRHTSMSAFMTTSEPFAHFALAREGSTIRSFKNGVLLNTTTWSGAMDTNLTNGLMVGDYVNHVSPHPFKGRIKGFRITKGVARYTANFTPPTLPLPTQ